MSYISHDEASFSARLNGVEEPFGTTIHGLTSSISTLPIFVKINTPDDGEIEVFDAEKYFKEGINNPCPIITLNNSLSHCHKKDDSLDVFSIKEERRGSGPQSNRSESSRRSRSVSFLNAPRKQKRPRRNAKRKCCLTCIAWKYSCTCFTGKNSTEVDDMSGEDCSRNGKSLQEDKTSGHLVRKSVPPESNYVKFNEAELRLNSAGHFSFHVSANQAGTMKLVQDEENQEVIGSPRLETMPWDIAIATAEEINIPCRMCTGSSSDTSSDLFEIKSLSKGSPFLSRQASDGLSSSITPKTGSSMEWGVVTATTSTEDLNVVSDQEGVR